MQTNHDPLWSSFFFCVAFLSVKVAFCLLDVLLRQFTVFAFACLKCRSLNGSYANCYLICSTLLHYEQNTHIWRSSLVGRHRLVDVDWRSKLLPPLVFLGCSKSLLDTEDTSRKHRNILGDITKKTSARGVQQLQENSRASYLPIRSSIRFIVCWVSISCYTYPIDSVIFFPNQNGNFKETPIFGQAHII